MFKKRTVSDKQILIFVRLLDASKKILVFLALLGQISSLVPWNALHAISTDIVEPIDVQDTLKDYPATIDPNFDYSEIKLLGEVNSLRTNNTKTFQRVDGSYVVSIYNDAVHYDENGTFESIDNSLGYESKSDLYTNKANAFKIKLPKKLDENKRIKLELDKYSVDWRVISINKSSIDIEKNDAKSNNLKELTDISQKVTYRNIMTGVDLEYIVNGTNVKENIILEKYINNFSISFEYSLKNLTLVQENDQVIFINDNGDEIFNFSNLYAFDANENETDLVQLKVENTKVNTYQITVTIDDEWLKEASFPVTIDPTINSSTQAISIFDTYVSQANPTSNYSTSTIMVLSNSSSEYRGLMYFYLPSHIMNKQITYSTLKLTKSIGAIDRTIGLYKNNSNFSSNTATWNNKPTISTTMTDYHVVGTSNTYLFNITKAVREWHATGVTRTTGFTIKDKSDVGAYNSVRSMDHSNSTYHPVIEIGYIDSAGIKDYWTYNSQHIGEYSTGYVSDFTGLLNIVRSDLNYSTQRQTLSLGFSYNIQDRSSNYGYFKGWNIVYNSYVEFDSYIGLYKSTDSTGNVVYYHSTTCDSRITAPDPYVYTCYMADDGSGNVLYKSTVYGSLSGYYIYTKNNIKQKYNSSGYLASITNEESNQVIYITRDTSDLKKVTKITDSSGNKIEITYLNGNISKSKLYIYQNSSTNPYLLEEVNYSYVAKLDGSGQYELNVEYSKNYDDTLLMTVDEVLKYDYDAYGRILATYDGDDERIEYDYNTSNKIAGIRAFYGASIFSEISYDYSLRKTIITDQNNDFVQYKFDDFGHTVNILDKYGNIQYYKYSNIFSNPESTQNSYIFIDGEPNYIHNHRLVSQSSPQSSLFNPINNHGFEYSGINQDVNWKYYNDTGEIQEPDRDLQSTREVLFGTYSAMINANAIDTGHFEQTIILDANAYTLTGYVKNETNSSNVWIDVEGHDQGGTVTYISPSEKWTKITMTFVVSNDNTEVTISLINHANGRAFFDNIQIYEGFVDNRTNMIDNPSFEYADSYGNVPGWTYSDIDYVYRTEIGHTIDDLYKSILGNHAIQIEGSSTASRSAVTSISEFLDTSMLDEKGKLVIGAWARSSGVPATLTQSDLDNGNDRHFRIRVDFVSEAVFVWGPEYDATIIKSEYIDFDTTIEGWNYQYGEVTLPDVDTYWVNVFFEYKGEESVYFDGLQVFFENAYTNYEYNSIYGNLTAVETSRGDRTEYSYDATKDYASKPTEVQFFDGTTLEISTDS
ncbi:MAG: DNRLRE domain-containing protein [Tenericutes bacterium]|nr:DNRLRE domain-containing protein [Mycoplasmatota bacterium]